MGADVRRRPAKIHSLIEQKGSKVKLIAELRGPETLDGQGLQGNDTAPEGSKPLQIPSIPVSFKPAGCNKYTPRRRGLMVLWPLATPASVICSCEEIRLILKAYAVSSICHFKHAPPAGASALQRNHPGLAQIRGRKSRFGNAESGIGDRRLASHAAPGAARGDCETYVPDSGRIGAGNGADAHPFIVGPAALPLRIAPQR